LSDLSNYLEDALVNAVLRNTSYTSPTTVYVALFTAVSDAEAGTGTEVSGGSYARQAVTFSAPSNGATSNSGIITFPTASAPWGTVTHAAIMDASTSGNCLTSIKALVASKTIGTGDILRFPIGDIDFSLA
jgi:hypothetical protein